MRSLRWSRLHRSEGVGQLVDARWGEVAQMCLPELVLASAGSRFESLLSQPWDSKGVFIGWLGVVLRRGHAVASLECVLEQVGERRSVSATSIEGDLNNTASGLYVGYLPCNLVPNCRKFCSHEDGRLLFSYTQRDFCCDALNFLRSHCRFTR